LIATSVPFHVPLNTSPYDPAPTFVPIVISEGLIIIFPPIRSAAWDDRDLETRPLLLRSRQTIMLRATKITAPAADVPAIKLILEEEGAFDVDPVIFLQDEDPGELTVPLGQGRHSTD